MSRQVKKINACDLPSDFWNKVIYYEYFISFDGFIAERPRVTAWTSDGEEYYINANEFRDHRFERVIPFFDSMADKEKIAKGEFLYFNWDLIPEGWNYFYYNSRHCFIPADVYPVFSQYMEQYKEDIQKKPANPKENIEAIVVRLLLWKYLLKAAYKDARGIHIQDDMTTYIRFDEMIHVYEVPYMGKDLKLDQVSAEDLEKLKKSSVWSIDYIGKGKELRNSIEIVVFFEAEEPFCLSCDFERQGASDYMDEDEFMKKFMELLECDFRSGENKYCLLKSPEGFTSFQIHEDCGKIFWIRDDLYRENYQNVIEPLIHYPGDRRFLSSPICGCDENRI